MKKTKDNRLLPKIFILYFILFGILFFSFQAAQAASLVPCGTSENPQACTLCHLVIGFKNIFEYLIKVVLFPLFTLGIVIAGVLYMVSSGNKGLIEKAKTALTYSLAGAVIALTSWLLVNSVLHALGYKSVGNWWNYTCDTAPTSGAGTTGTGGSTVPPNTGVSGKGRDIQVPQDGSKLAEILQKEKGAVYVYGGDPNSRNGNGDLMTDCSGWVKTVWQETYGESIPRESKYQGNEPYNQSALVNGTILESNGHVGIYYDGSVYHNSQTGGDVKVVSLDQYLSNHSVYEMRRPPV